MTNLPSCGAPACEFKPPNRTPSVLKREQNGPCLAISELSYWLLLYLLCVIIGIFFNCPPQVLTSTRYRLPWLVKMLSRG